MYYRHSKVVKLKTKMIHVAWKVCDKFVEASTARILHSQPPILNTMRGK